jgi:hypothetical protein
MNNCCLISKKIEWFLSIIGYENYQRRRNRRIAEQLAEDMHQKLEAKRRNPSLLTEEEMVERAAWRARLTPRSKC